MILSALLIFKIKRRVHIYIKLKKWWTQFSGERLLGKQNIINVIIDYYLINTYLPQVNFVVWSFDSDSPTNSIQSKCVIPLCHSPHFVLPQIFAQNGAGKRKIVTENLEKLLSLLHIYLLHLEKTKGFFQQGRKKEKFEISHFFKLGALAKYDVNFF